MWQKNFLAEVTSNNFPSGIKCYVATDADDATLNVIGVLTWGFSI